MKLLKTINGIKIFEELESVYSYIRTTKIWKDKKVEIMFDYKTKEYEIKIFDEKETDKNKNVDIFVDMDVVYGDSVVGDTPLILKDPITGNIHIETIESIFDKTNKIHYPDVKIGDKIITIDKHYSNTKFQVWSDKGWGKINKVIRHKTNKKIYKILTQSGFVKVTEDHSLINIENKLIKPIECNLDTILLNKYPNKFHYSKPIKSMSNSYARFLGFLCRDKVPNEILNSNNEIIRNYIDGYNSRNINIDIEYNQVGYAGLYYLVKKIGGNVKFNIDENKYRMIIKKNKSMTEKIYDMIKSTNITNKIIEIKEDNVGQKFVYDLETDTGRFQAGIGNIIVKNTDSVMVRMRYNRDDWKKNRKDSFELGIECADILTNKIFNRYPIEMEMENIYNPLLLLMRKRYCAKKFEDKHDVLKMKGIITKGLATTRRDYNILTQNCLKKSIEAIMKAEGDPLKKDDIIHDSVSIYLETLLKIKEYNVKLDDIKTSATLKKDYKNENLAHVKLFKKMTERKEDIHIGDRIQFIFIEDTSNEHKERNELAEDPKFVKKHNLKINRIFYTQKLAKVMLGFYKHILDQESTNKLLETTNDYIKSYTNEKKELLKENDFLIDEDLT